MSKEIGINELATLIKGEFNRIDERFEDIRDEFNSKFSKIDQKLKQAEFRAMEDKEELKQEIKDAETRLRRDFIDSSDQIITELKTVREEQVANVGAHDRIQGVIDNHEVRIGKLETRAV